MDASAYITLDETLGLITLINFYCLQKQHADLNTDAVKYGEPQGGFVLCSLIRELKSLTAGKLK